ncbi:carbohydrate-binding module family 1 protein/Glycoside hydrolase family 5 protein [Mycena maculata]|uniref:cellulase n=1 Tax=Mycena maculata TaxID=230809 RepID=A0AAD7I6E6_9AGAR|nr:carbohydrate-binding module family 1 protein/Glycoside hydrolase family 5 protein [Mycena maculata]
MIRDVPFITQKGWTGATTCETGSVCTVANAFYSQCLPGTASTTIGTTSGATTSTVSTSTRTRYVPTRTAINPAKGFDFGCNSDGDCSAGAAYPPLTQYYGADGAGQMSHFVNDDGYNTFRLPIGWQYLTNFVLGGPLDPTMMTEYDALVQACLTTGAYCIIDIHNYARWDGEIIGQGGPTNEQFASTWSAIAAMYQNETKVIFGVMNEPHDLPDINLWAGTVQAAVTAIRNAGATTQMILLPGDNWTSAETFVSNGSAAALAQVVNPDGSTTNLIFDVHKYLDVDNSGTHSECTTNNIVSSWEPLAQWLRCNGRQAFNTEAGGGYDDPTCFTNMCQQIAYQAQNSDVYLGYVGWAAGNFYTGYVLSELPVESGTTWTDVPLVSMCMAPNAGAQKGSTGL